MNAKNLLGPESSPLALLVGKEEGGFSCPASLGLALVGWQEDEKESMRMKEKVVVAPEVF